MGDIKRTVSEIAHAAHELVAEGGKSGAIAPLRDAMALLDLLISGDYENPVRTDGKDEEPTSDAVTTPKPKSKDKRRARKPRR